MVFANLTFLYLFLPANLLLYYASKNNTWRNVVLTIFSMIFYAWGEPVCILLLLFSTLTYYGNALLIDRYRGQVWGKVALVLGLVVNLGILGVFKYSGFFMQTINSLGGWNLPVPALVLPIGISFYTFQLISYMVDVYRDDAPVQRSFYKLLMYVSMYPQLVAGPIVRYSHIAAEIDNRQADFPLISRGITRFAVGLFKKVMVANYAGQLAGVYLDGDLTKLSTPAAWVGLLLFSLQIYYDFSGYSDMAIGLGYMFGFHFQENFNYPYISRSISEFWRRWHISLGSFFRDYVYIPLGGNRTHMVRNLLVVWFLTGLWHGASWNFVLWGLYFGVLILLERLFLGKLLQKMPAAVSTIYSLFCIMIGWAVFYYTDLTRLGQFLRVLFGGVGGDLSALQVMLMNNIIWLVLAIAFCIPLSNMVKEWTQSKELFKGQVLAAGWVQVAANLVLLMVCTAMLVGQSYNPFLYFRF